MIRRFNQAECHSTVESLSMKAKLNEMQNILERTTITSIEDSWQIFYEQDIETGDIKGFVILFVYNRMPCNPDYNTGRVAEVELFTFPQYRHQGVCSRLVQEAVAYADKCNINIVADCQPSGYAVLKSLGFKDSTEKRVWMHLS